MLHLQLNTSVSNLPVRLFAACSVSPFPLPFLKICNRKRGWQSDPQHLLTACTDARWKKKFIYRCQRMVKNYTRRGSGFQFVPLSVSSFACPLSPMNILKRTPETSIRCLRNSPRSALNVSTIWPRPRHSSFHRFFPRPTLPHARRVSYFFVQIRVGLPTNRVDSYLSRCNCGSATVCATCILYTRESNCFTDVIIIAIVQRSYSINDPSFDHRVSNRINRCCEIDRCTRCYATRVCVYIYKCIWEQLCSSTNDAKSIQDASFQRE